MVDKLMIAEERQWNVGLLHELFFQEEVEKILRMSLSLRTVADRRIWHYERHEKFSVRNVFHVARPLIAVVGVDVRCSASISYHGRGKL